MVFSKTFGYAIRSILFLTASGVEKRIQLTEVASKLKVPRHFLAKVMKKLASEGVIGSQKGPNGGFSCTEQTLKTNLFKIVSLTGDAAHFDSCVLRLKKCNAQNPCPMHNEAQALRNQWLELLCNTSINDLLKGQHPDFIRSIALP
jgi:Rrf2 family protein